MPCLQPASLLPDEGIADVAKISFIVKMIHLRTCYIMLPVQHAC
jgi:hypothetical protein